MLLDEGSESAGVAVARTLDEIRFPTVLRRIQWSAPHR
jgi:hypothetical protein